MHVHASESHCNTVSCFIIDCNVFFIRDCLLFHSHSIYFPYDYWKCYVNYKRELPHGYPPLLLLLLCPAICFIQQAESSWICIHLLLVRGNPPDTFPVGLFLLLFTFAFLSDCNGHLVLKPPAPSICFCLSFLFICLSLQHSSLHFCAATTSLFFGSSSIAWRVKLSLPITDTSMGIWVQRGDGGWKGETVAWLWLTHVLFYYWLASC